MKQGFRSSWVPSALASCFLMLGMVGLFIPLPGRFRAPWLSSLQDLAHVPFFAIVTFALFVLLRGRIWLAAAIALAIAGGTELLQGLAQRSGSLGDFWRNAAGVLLAVSWVGFARIQKKTASRKLAITVIALVCLGLPLAERWPVLWDAVHSWKTFPVLADFQTPWQTHRWSMAHGELRLTHTNPGDNAGLFVALPNEHSWSALVLFPIRRDWSSYRSLSIEFSLPERPTELLFSLRDGRPVEPPRRRFDLRQVFSQGRHTMTFDLQELATGSSDRAPVDISKVMSFHMVVFHEGERRGVLVHRLWLHDGAPGETSTSSES